MAPRLSLEQKAQIIDDFTAGQHPITIAEVNNVPVASVYRTLRDQGMYTGHKGRRSVIDRFTGEQIEQMIEDYQGEELSVREILTQYGMSQQQLWNILSVLQIPTRKHRKARLLTRKAREDKACQMYMDGCPIKEIFGETGFGYSQLYNVLYERGVPLRTRRRNFEQGE